jgi:hypothetical protein
MSSDVEISRSPARASIRMLVALFVGLSFAFRSGLSFAGPNFWNATSLLDYLAVVSWSLALASLAAGAWLVAILATRRRAVTAAAGVLALGGLVAAVANLIEDGLGLKAFGEIYAYGPGGVLVGLLWLAVALALARRWWLVGLSLATFVGLFSTEFGGGLLILAGWAVLAIVVRRDEGATRLAERGSA